MSRHPYIAIEGVIGVGKTTLARLLQPELKGELILEVFEENPFLSDFYGDRMRYAFQTQIFFLLSRYRQQTSTVPSALLHGSVIADYTFSKDRLFAKLNLSGDELAVYQRVYQALSEKTRQPDLLVYLRADLDVLMARIALRDRPYERNMDPTYIKALIDAYDEFVNHYEGAHLVIDTNDLNFVQNQSDLRAIVKQVKSSMELGTYQAKLPGVASNGNLEPSKILEDLQHTSRRLIDYQHFHLDLDATKGFDNDPFFNFLCFSEEVGELAEAFKLLWAKEKRLIADGLSSEQAHHQATDEFRRMLSNEMADCLAYLMKLGSYLGIDLEEAYFEKMNYNLNRKWVDGKDMKGAK